MADDAVFAGPSKGPPPWLIIGGVGAVVIGVILLTRSGGGGTTAAGASINAGLGSLQEEQMNLLGTVQAGQLANNANFTSIGGQIADTQKAILDAINAQGTQTGQQIQNAIDNVNQNTNAQNQSVMGALADALSRLLSGQQQITQTVQSESQTIQSQVGGVASNIQQSQNQIINQLGTIQASEQSILNMIGPALSQLIDQSNQIISLQQQLQTASGAQAQAIQAQISNLQSAVQAGQAQIQQTLGQMDAHNQVNFNAVQGGLGTLYQSMLDQFYGVGYAIANVGYHVGANPNPATDPNCPSICKLWQ